jgi:iron complex outermembrane receptor protein
MLEWASPQSGGFMSRVRALLSSSSSIVVGLCIVLAGTDARGQTEEVEQQKQGAASPAPEAQPAGTLSLPPVDVAQRRPQRAKKQAATKKVTTRRAPVAPVAPAPSDQTPRAPSESDTRTVPLNATSATSSRLGLSIKETPASVEVLTQEALRERGSRVLREAIEQATGFTAGAIPNITSTVSVRGFINNSVNVLYDGVGLPHNSTSARYTDVGNLERIEFLRGPASVLYGDGAVGAVINLIPRYPTWTPKADAEYSFSSFNSHRVHAGVGGPILGNAAAVRFDATVNNYGSSVKLARTQLEQYNGAILLPLGEDLTLTLSAEKQIDDIKNAYWGTPFVNGQLAGFLRTVNYNNLTDSRVSSDSDWLRANLVWTPNKEWEIRNIAYRYNAYRYWHNVENFLYNAGSNPPTVTRSSFGDLDHHHNVLGDRFQARHIGEIAGFANRFVIGAEVSTVNWKTSRNGFPGSQVVDAFNPPEVPFSAVTPILRTPARDVSLDSWAIFVEDQLSLTKQLKLLVGGRFDYFEGDWLYIDMGGLRRKQTYREPSYRGAVLYDITPLTTIYASYTTASEGGGSLYFLSPQQTELGLTDARQTEVGLKQDIFGRGEFTFAAYHIVKKNLFVPDPANPTNRIQVGQQSSKGVEATLAYRLNEQWKFDANAAFVDARLDDFTEGNPPVSRAGNIPQFVPKYVMNVGVRYAPFVSWEFGAWLRHVDSVFIDNANTRKLPAYTTVDLSAVYKYSANIEFAARIRNLTDALYATWSAPTQAYIAEPRTFEVSARAKF